MIRRMRRRGIWEMCRRDRGEAREVRRRRRGSLHSCRRCSVRIYQTKIEDLSCIRIPEIKSAQQRIKVNGYVTYNCKYHDNHVCFLFLGWSR